MLNTLFKMREERFQRLIWNMAIQRASTPPPTPRFNPGTFLAPGSRSSNIQIFSPFQQWTNIGKLQNGPNTHPKNYRFWTKHRYSSFTQCSFCRDIPSEKIGQNIHPPKSCFFVINHQHWTGTSAFRPFLAPRDHWGGLGGPGGGLGGLQTPKMT